MNKDDTVYYPQDEMNTMLIPVTIGCYYNRCAFCSMYKDVPYSEVPFFEIEMNLMNGYEYTEKVFLTGADPVAIGFEKLVKLLEMIKKHLPYCACVASYASIRSISMYSLEELSALHDLGLRLLYIGFETGSDKVLKMMRKGHVVDTAVEQALKLNRAHIRFNSIIMYGIAGSGKCEENAIETAKMLGRFETERIITMNLTVFDGAELYDMVKRGEFTPPSKEERLMEIAALLENIQPKKSAVFDTTHPTNLIKIKGRVPEERERLLAEVNSYWVSTQLLWV